MEAAGCCNNIRVCIDLSSVLSLCASPFILLCFVIPASDLFLAMDVFYHVPLYISKMFAYVFYDVVLEAPTEEV